MKMIRIANRKMLIILGVSSVACVLWVYGSSYLRQDRAVSLLEDRGAHIVYSCSIGSDGERCESLLLRVVLACGLDCDLFWRVSYVYFEGVQAKDEDVVAASQVPGLEGLGLVGQRNLTDEVLPVISEMQHLRRLNVIRAGFSKAGLERLQRKRPHLAIDQ